MKKFVYTYKLTGNPPHNSPVNVIDNGTRTRFANFPVVRNCGVVSYLSDPCEGFNYNLCGIDAPFFQPFCVSDSSNECDIPDGYARIRFKYERLRFDRANLVLNLTSEGNSYIDTYISYNPNLSDVSGFYLPIMDFYANESDDLLHGNRFSESLSGGNIFYTEYLGNDVYDMFFNVDIVRRIYGIDICRERLVLLGPSGYVMTEVTQPVCCDLDNNLSCPIEPGFIGIDFEVRVTNNNFYDFTITFEELGCGSLTSDNMFRHRFRGSQSGSFTQSSLDSHILNGFQSRRGFKLERVGEGKFRLLVSSSYLVYNFDWSFLGGSVVPCMLTPLVCGIGGVIVNVETSLLCCRKETSIDCDSLSDFLQYSYTINNGNYNLPTNDAFTINGLHVHIPYITDGGSDDAMASVVSMDMKVYMDMDFSSYLVHVESRWNKLFYETNPGIGFVRRIGNRFDIFINRESYRNILRQKAPNLDECGISAFIFEIDYLYPPSVVPVIKRTFDFDYRVSFSNPESYIQDVRFIESSGGQSRSIPGRFIGQSFMPYCCRSEINLPRCCPCSEYTLCNISGLLNASLQRYILDSSGRTPTEVYPKFSGQGLLEELKRYDSGLLSIAYENDCYYMQFMAKETLNDRNIREDDTVMMQIALYPKTSCNHSYIIAVFIDMKNGSLNINGTISKSKFPGAVIPNQLHIFDGSSWVRPSGFEESSVNCLEDTACDDSVISYDSDCEVCAHSCNVTDKLYFQFQMPDYYNDWSSLSFGELREGIDYGWIDSVKRRESGSKWLCSVEVINKDNKYYALSDFMDKGFVGSLKDGRFIQQIIINPSKLPNDFYLRFIFNTPKGEVYVYSEPFERANCSDTLLMEGIYPFVGKASIDCSGNVYESAEKYIGQNFRNRLLARVPGTINYDNFEITSTRNNNRTIKVDTQSKYKMRTLPLPPYMVDKVKNILESQVILINGSEYLFEGYVNRNNNDGSMWIIEANLTRVDRSCNQINFSCLS